MAVCSSTILDGGLRGGALALSRCACVHCRFCRDRRPPDQITYASAKDWGLLGWAKEIVPVLMDSVSEAVDFELRALPGCTYYRLQVPHLQDASSDMDDADPENLRELQGVAEEYVASISDQLTKVCAELKEGRGSNMPGIGRAS